MLKPEENGEKRLRRYPGRQKKRALCFVTLIILKYRGTFTGITSPPVDTDGSGG